MTRSDTGDGESARRERPASVLVVEDDPLQRRVLCKRLAASGVATIHEAEHGIEALALLAAHPDVEVVVSDLAMPEMDGLDLLCAMATLPSKASFVLHSAMDRQLLACMELMAKERGMSFLGILEKPATVDDIQRVVRRPEPKERPSRETLVFSHDELKEGLALGQFVPYFQPKVSMKDGAIRGAEALARWVHPRYGVLPPGVFIDTMEQTGLIGSLTQIILEKSIRAARTWNDLGRSMSVSVNLSFSFLSTPGVADSITRLTRGSGLAPERLILEITENVAMADAGICLENIARLKVRGYRLSIDDFGVGYSSLQQLLRIPFDEIKIDRSFVSGVKPLSRSATMLEATLGMAQRLDMVSVAEGIETREEWDFLASVGTALAQGYFVSRPISGDDLEARLRAGTEWVPPR
jgi:EAL domain-containing protein (putative c-di-GMP-specific phosphodiesterase class I)